MSRRAVSRTAFPIHERCRVSSCTFTVVGLLRLHHTTAPASWPVGVCAVHRDAVTANAIDNPTLGRVEWFPRRDWHDDGLAYASIAEER